MLVGGNLGFSWLVVLFLLASVVIGFVVRRKWRLAVARREEIRRLLVLAAEEAARAELEASTGYLTAAEVIPQQLQYQCAVCFSPTTTRCARCKAVRYCSGKCQIIHWRQGHKEECRPFVTTNPINDVRGDFVQKVNNQKEYETYGNSVEPEERQCAEPVEKFPEEPAFSNSRTSPKLTTSSLSNGVHAKLETTYANNLDQTASPLLENLPSVKSIATFTSSAKLNNIKIDCSDGDSHCESTSSSGWTVEGSNESSLSEPSTPTSGFWEGTIDSRRPLYDDLHDSAGTGGGILDFKSSVHYPFNLVRDSVPPLHEQGHDAKRIILDDDCPTSTRINKPNGGAILHEERRKDTSKPRISPSPNSKISQYMDNDTIDDSRTVNIHDNKSFCGSASSAHPGFSTGRHSKSTDASNVSHLPSLVSERSNHVVYGLNSASHVPKSREVGHLSSRPSNAHLSSSTVVHSVSAAKSAEVDNCRVVLGAKSVKVDNCRVVNAASRKGLKSSVMKVVNQLTSSELPCHCSLGVGSGMTRRYNDKGLFSYELFVKLYTSKKIELRPCGLTNCGNSCYVNAVLQCLAFTPPLTAYLLEGLHSKACEKKGWCFTCEFESLILKVKEGDSPLSPMGILSHLQNIGSHLDSGREEDAHEFLRYAIDTMQSVCLKETGVDPSGSLDEETTLIGLTFGGYLQSKIKCMKCGGKSEQHEKMMDLTVEIDGDIETLEEALRKFTSNEILDGQNKYHCSRCKSYEKAKKRLTVLEAPNVLTIALKRFQSGKFGKLNKTVRFPEILDLAPCMSGTSDKSPIYRLYGVVVHLDVMNASFSGHYVCYIKNIQNKWFKVDDSTVRAVEIDGVLAKEAYMLLYARCSPRSPRLIRNSIKPCDPRKTKNPTVKSRSHTPGLCNGQTDDYNHFYSNHPSLQRAIIEEDSSSDNTPSLGFSEEGTSSTESSTVGSSTSSDDLFDQIFGDSGHYHQNCCCRNCSDSDTSSSSSSPSHSHLYSRHSPISFDWYSSRYDNPESAMEGHGLRSRLSNQHCKIANLEGMRSDHFLSSDTTENCKNLSSSSSCRLINSDRSGQPCTISTREKMSYDFKL